MARIVNATTDRLRNRRGLSPSTWRFGLQVIVCAAAGFIVAYGVRTLPGVTGMLEDLVAPPAIEVAVPEEGFLLGRLEGRFPLCMNTGSSTCVVDGDTIKVWGTPIRIADIDTPEVFSPRCASEKRLGERAARRLAALLSQGGFDLMPYNLRDEDRYGRKLRIVSRDGRSIGMTLVSEGLAREWDGMRRSWC